MPYKHIARPIGRWIVEDRYVRSRRVAAALWLVLSFTFVLWLVEHRHHEEEHRQQHQITLLCDYIQVNHDALSDIVADTGSGGGTDLTSLPSFARLDPAQQQYLRDLQDALASSAAQNSTFQQRAKKRLDQATLGECPPPSPPSTERIP